MNPTVQVRERGSKARISEALVALSSIEDDGTTRMLLVDLLEENGYSVRSYEGAMEYLTDHLGCEPSCILLDVRLRGMSGLELQDKLRDARAPPWWSS